MAWQKSTKTIFQPDKARRPEKQISMSGALGFAVAAGWLVLTVVSYSPASAMPSSWSSRSEARSRRG